MDFLDKWWNSCGHANTLGSGRKAADFAPALGITVVGTDTEVGKTRVAQLLIRQLVERGKRVGAYKPVASGTWPLAADSDAAHLHRATGLDCPLERVCPQSFLAPLAPPIAARREGKCVDEQLLRTGVSWWREQCDVLVVEGAGGALSPLGWKTTVLDLACDLGYPVVLVAAHRLGMMNHVLLTLEAIRRRELAVAALVINQPKPLDLGGEDLGGEDLVRDASLMTGVASQPAGRPEAEVRLDESVACLLPFCGKIDCYRLDYEGSTLFPLA